MAGQVFDVCTLYLPLLVPSGTSALRTCRQPSTHNEGKQLSFILPKGAGLGHQMGKVINAWDEAQCFTQEFCISGVGLSQLIIPNQLPRGFL